MRTHSLRLAAALFAAMLLTTACTNQDGLQTPENERQVRTIGSQAATTLGRTLMSRVQAAFEEGGAVYALDFCSLRAQPLTAEVNTGLGDTLQVKRTSTQYRNPLNAPDQYEQEALQYFEQAMAEQGELPPYYVQFVNALEYRYYRPITVGEFCLNCHGDPATFSPELRQVLNERYPNDQATGYQEDDFRGVFRVTVSTYHLE